MKYELIKDLPGLSAGTVIELRDDNNWYVVGFDKPCIYNELLKYGEDIRYFTDFLKEVVESQGVSQPESWCFYCDSAVCELDQVEEQPDMPVPTDFTGLNEKQEKHRKEVVVTAMNLIHEKYTKGALEHKTNLKQDTTPSQLVDFALEEAVDQMVYLITLKQKLNEGWEW